MNSENIIEICGMKNYMKATRINDNDCYLVKDYKYNNGFCNYYYDCLNNEVVLRTKENNILTFYCDCINNNNGFACEHIAKVLISKYMKTSKNSIINDISTEIANNIINSNKVDYWNVEIDFEFIQGTKVSIKPKI